ncbi:hypothetical protein N8263_02885 [Flavobacteriaceae bacterium]|nr:hypothetical protein [Flavobacteriaceae bacterium]
MKKLLLLLLFIPLVSFGQITLQEILAIETEQDFKRTFIENGFQEETTEEESEKLVVYNKQIVNISIGASFRRSDSLSAKAVAISFSPDIFGKNDIYDGIYNKVKEECKFTGIRNELNMDLAFYLCPNENPDPELLELQKTIEKEFTGNFSLPDETKDLNITNLEIGFVKHNDLYIILNPIYDQTENIKMIKQLIEFKRQAEKELNQ